jgi:ParB family chromosome partitioning protein
VNTKRKEQPYSSQLKGVQALLGDLPNDQSTFSAVITDIIPSLAQPRYYFDPEKQQQLVQSVKQYGILEPLLVRPIPENKYEIVAGERRYRAAIDAGLTQVPIVVKELNDEEALHLALIENLQRVDLNPIEETEGILTLLSINLSQKAEDVIRLLYRMQNEAKGKVTQNVLGNSDSQKIIEVFQAVGTLSWESFVNSRLSLLKLPTEILEALRQGKLEYTKATAIAKIKEEDKRAELLKEAIQNQLSLTQIKARIAELKPSPDVSSSENKAQTLARRLKQLKLWEKDKKAWKKVEGWLDKIESLLLEIETDGEKIASQSSDLSKVSSAKITKENQAEHTEEKSIPEKNADILVEESSSDEELDEDKGWDCDI